MGLVGPLWARREDHSWTYGLWVRDEHLNPVGVMHGGAIATLLDQSISTIAWEAADRAPCVTVQLDTHYLGAIQPGSFVEARAHVTHRSASLLFVRGDLSVQGQLVATGQSVLKVLRSV